MARIVLGIGTSHSPSLNNDVDNWLPPAGEIWDRPRLAAAKLGDWDELVRQKATWIPGQLQEDRIRERYAACQGAIRTLEEVLHEVAPDVLVVVGDDHYEVFSPDHMPAVSLHWANSIPVPPHRGRVEDPLKDKELSDYFYPGNGDLAEHLIYALVDEGFDLAYTRTFTTSGGLGHAFDFICRRLMNGHPIPQVPMLLNTYYPPNRPSVSRCYALGRALRRAIDSYPSDARVGMVGSGGLTHMVINEEMDHAVLSAIHDRDEKGLTCYPESEFVDGTSEIKAWVVLAGAMEEAEQEMTLVDYQPCYRSPAGTGCAMAFAYWA